jgi:hypothetical protein
MLIKCRHCADVADENMRSDLYQSSGFFLRRYVEAVVDFLLTKSINTQFTAFAEGFRILCDGPATRLFNAQVWKLFC